jgi:xeroderma pigmentosum group C-complementing protein
MPPFLPRKRRANSEFDETCTPKAQHQSKRAVFEALDAEPPNRLTLEEVKALKFTHVFDSDSDSSLSDAPSSIADEGVGEERNDEEEEEEEEGEEDDGEVNWEDAIPSAPSTSATPIPLQDLELTLTRDNNGGLTDKLGGANLKKGPSKVERFIRIQTHCMHVQCLLFHNALRNSWISDAKVHEILRSQLPEGIQREVQRWRAASGLEVQDQSPTVNANQKKKSKTLERDWGEESTRVEPGQPDMSRGDPIISLLRVLCSYWKKKFKITVPGLRKKGYKPILVLEAEVIAFQMGDGDYECGEKIKDLTEFRRLAERSEGSRDTGAQLFTALLRALGIRARMVASLQPIGFGWTKVEDCLPKTERLQIEKEDSDTDESHAGAYAESTSTVRKGTKANRKKDRKIDRDLPFPIYWTEVASPITHEIIPIDALVLPNAVATTPELLALFEPRGAKAERAKQVIAYVVAYSPDGTAKDVTVRYLRRHAWPGKTKGFRMPVEKVPLHSGSGPTRYYVYDWFKNTMRGYVRPDSMRTIVDEKEDTTDLVLNQTKRKAPKEGDTLQSLRSSTDFVLERFLRREEAIRPGARHVRTFVSGKGEKQKVEKVYKRSDVETCLSAESWHKEGRRIKLGETPLKLVPVRAVTLTRKREVEEAERETGEKQKQGLYALRQTEYIIPPPIRDGKIPRNEYGNIDCFVPSMIPQGATHIPWGGTVRICKKLGVDYAEAVTGFEFGSRRAVPIISGVVVAAENEGLVKDAWLNDEAERRKKEQLKHNQLILSTWRKFTMGLRISERIREEYGDEDGDAQAAELGNAFTNQRTLPVENGDLGEAAAGQEDGDGGFLLPDDCAEVDEHVLIADHIQHHRKH